MSLQDWMLEQAPPVPQEARTETYRIGAKGNPLGEAAWAMRKLARLRYLQDAAKREAAAEIDLVKAWLHGELHRLDGDAAFFEGALLDWHRREMTEALETAAGDWSKVDGKTRRLPNGQIVARQTPPRVEVNDDTFLASAPEALVRVTREPDKTAILAAVKATGEIPDGVTLTLGDVTYSVVVDPEPSRKAADL